MRWGPLRSPNEGGPLAHAVGALVVHKRRRPPCLGGPKAKEVYSPTGGPGGRKWKVALSPMWWGPRWSQRDGGPRAYTAGA